MTKSNAKTTGQWLACYHCTTRFWGVVKVDDMGLVAQYCPKCANDCLQQKQTKRFIRLKGTNTLLELSKATQVKTNQRMIHLDQLPDGTWRLIWDPDLIPDITQLEALEIVRQDETVQSSST